LQRATVTTKMKLAKVRVEPKTIGTADINATTTRMVPLEWQTQRFIQSASHARLIHSHFLFFILRVLWRADYHDAYPVVGEIYSLLCKTLALVLILCYEKIWQKDKSFWQTDIDCSTAIYFIIAYMQYKSHSCAYCCNCNLYILIVDITVHSILDGCSLHRSYIVGLGADCLLSTY